MVKNALSMVWRNALSIALGSLAMVLAVAMAPWMFSRMLADYDRTHPVWTEPAMRIVAEEGDSLTLDVRATKARDCRFLRIHAQVEDSSGFAKDTGLDRVDQPVMGRTKPTGEQQLGVFRVAVPASAAAASIYVENSCEGRVVLSELPIPIARKQ